MGRARRDLDGVGTLLFALGSGETPRSTPLPICRSNWTRDEDGEEKYPYKTRKRHIGCLVSRDFIFILTY